MKPIVVDTNIEVNEQIKMVKTTTGFTASFAPPMSQKLPWQN